MAYYTQKQRNNFKNRAKDAAKRWAADKPWVLADALRNVVVEIAPGEIKTPADRQTLNTCIRTAIQYMHDEWVAMYLDEDVVKVIVKRLTTGWQEGLTIAQKGGMLLSGRGIKNAVDAFAVSIGAQRVYRRA